MLKNLVKHLSVLSNKLRKSEGQFESKWELEIGSTNDSKYLSYYKFIYELYLIIFKLGGAPSLPLASMSDPVESSRTFNVGSERNKKIKK